MIILTLLLSPVLTGKCAKLVSERKCLNYLCQVGKPTVTAQDLNPGSCWILQGECFNKRVVKNASKICLISSKENVPPCALWCWVGHKNDLSAEEFAAELQPGVKVVGRSC